MFSAFVRNWHLADPETEESSKGQLAQVEEPVVAAYVSAAQGVHIVEDVPEYIPAAQLLQDGVAAPELFCEYIPAEQMVHADWPVAAANWPAVQLTQAALAMLGDAVPIPQLVQVVDPWFSWHPGIQECTTS